VDLAPDVKAAERRYDKVSDYGRKAEPNQIADP
jgi:hypothetical protein